jgi:hypothetical protein
MPAHAAAKSQVVSEKRLAARSALCFTRQPLVEALMEQAQDKVDFASALLL